MQTREAEINKAFPNENRFIAEALLATNLTYKLDTQANNTALADFFTNMSTKQADQKETITQLTTHLSKIIENDVDNQAAILQLANTLYQNQIKNKIRQTLNEQKLANEMINAILASTTLQYHFEDDSAQALVDLSNILQTMSTEYEGRENPAIEPLLIKIMITNNEEDNQNIKTISTGLSNIVAERIKNIIIKQLKNALGEDKTRSIELALFVGKSSAYQYNDTCQIDPLTKTIKLLFAAPLDKIPEEHKEDFIVQLTMDLQNSGMIIPKHHKNIRTIAESIYRQVKTHQETELGLFKGLFNSFPGIATKILQENKIPFKEKNKNNFNTLADALNRIDWTKNKSNHISAIIIALKKAAEKPHDETELNRLAESIYTTLQARNEKKQQKEEEEKKHEEKPTHIGEKQYNIELNKIPNADNKSYDFSAHGNLLLKELPNSYVKQKHLMKFIRIGIAQNNSESLKEYLSKPDFMQRLILGNVNKTYQFARSKHAKNAIKVIKNILQNDDFLRKKIFQYLYEKKNKTDREISIRAKTLWDFCRDDYLKERWDEIKITKMATTNDMSASQKLNIFQTPLFQKPHPPAWFKREDIIKYIVMLQPGNDDEMTKIAVGFLDGTTFDPANMHHDFYSTISQMIPSASLQNKLNKLGGCIRVLRLKSLADPSTAITLFEKLIFNPTQMQTADLKSLCGGDDFSTIPDKLYDKLTNWGIPITTEIFDTIDNIIHQIPQPIPFDKTNFINKISGTSPIEDKKPRKPNPTLDLKHIIKSTEEKKVETKTRTKEKEIKKSEKMTTPSDSATVKTKFTSVYLSQQTLLHEKDQAVKTVNSRAALNDAANAWLESDDIKPVRSLPSLDSPKVPTIEANPNTNFRFIGNLIPNEETSQLARTGIKQSRNAENTKTEVCLQDLAKLECKDQKITIKQFIFGKKAITLPGDAYLHAANLIVQNHLAFSNDKTHIDFNPNYIDTTNTLLRLKDGLITAVMIAAQAAGATCEIIGMTNKPAPPRPEQVTAYKQKISSILTTEVTIHDDEIKHGLP